MKSNLESFQHFFQPSVDETAVRSKHPVIDAGQVGLQFVCPDHGLAVAILNEDTAANCAQKFLDVGADDVCQVLCHVSAFAVPVDLAYGSAPEVANRSGVVTDFQK